MPSLGVLVLGKYVASGIGSIAGPMLAPWKARREAEAKRIAAQGEADALAILAAAQAESLPRIAAAQGEVRGQLTESGVITTAEIAMSKADIEQRVLFQDEKRQRNISAIAAQAADELEDTAVTDHEPDHDWAAHFFNLAQDVSSEEMQKLWAKVLAGEVERPGGTSILTLGVLKDLDRPTALLFRKLCSASISIGGTDSSFADVRVPSLGENAASNSLRPYGLNFDALNVLNEHRLIIADYNSYYDYRLCLGVALPDNTSIVRIPFRFQGRFWLLEPTGERSKDGEFRVSGVSLTRSGRELARVVDIEPMPDYTQAIIKFFEKQGLRMVEVPSGNPQARPL